MYAVKKDGWYYNVALGGWKETLSVQCLLDKPPQESFLLVLEAEVVEVHCVEDQWGKELNYDYCSSHRLAFELLSKPDLPVVIEKQGGGPPPYDFFAGLYVEKKPKSMDVECEQVISILMD